MIHVPTAAWAHTTFDLAAWGGGLALSVVLYRWRLRELTQAVARKVDGGYFAALALGAIPGAWFAGSLTSLRFASPALSHNVVGALVGAIVAVEIYKRLRGIIGSTGGVFVGSFSLGVVIGRLGCFFAGLPDGTLWDCDPPGVGRHPVQLYESSAMALFLALYLVGLQRRSPWAMRRGFYAMCVWYGGDDRRRLRDGRPVRDLHIDLHDRGLERSRPQSLRRGVRSSHHFGPRGDDRRTADADWRRADLGRVLA